MLSSNIANNRNLIFRIFTKHERIIKTFNTNKKDILYCDEYEKYVKRFQNIYDANLCNANTYRDELTMCLN